MLRRMLGAMGLGAGLMYLFDPEHGQRRRTDLREKALRWRRDLDEATAAVMHDLQCRSHDLMNDVRTLVGKASSGQAHRSEPTHEHLRPAMSDASTSQPPTGPFLWGAAGTLLTLHGLATRCLTSSLLGTITLGTTVAKVASTSGTHGSAEKGNPPKAAEIGQTGGAGETSPRKLVLPGGGTLPEITGTKEHPGTMAAEALENSRIGVPTSHASKTPPPVGINPG